MLLYEPDEERALSELLRSIAAEDATVTPPARLEAEVMARWEAQRRVGSPRLGAGHEHRRSRRMAAAIGWLGVAAAAAWLVTVVVPRPGRVAVDAPRVPARSTSVAEPSPRDAVAQPVQEDERQTAPAVQRRASARAASRERQAQAVSFVPLVPMTEHELTGSFQLVRVRLPRSALAGLGVALEPEGVTDPVPADVLLGEDGMARAIRIATEDVRRLR
jgi:hypothetical protein